MSDALSPDVPSAPDPVIEAYKKDVDRTLIRENLKKTHEERVLALESMLEVVYEVRRAGEALRRARE